MLVGLTALALVMGLFLSALHTIVSGPGSAAGGAAQAGVPPLGLGRQGAGLAGPGFGSGQSGPSGIGASTGNNRGQGSGSGPGSGTPVWRVNSHLDLLAAVPAAVFGELCAVQAPLPRRWHPDRGSAFA